MPATRVIKPLITSNSLAVYIALAKGKSNYDLTKLEGSQEFGQK